MQPDIAELTRLAKAVRRDILVMLHKAGSGHIGGSFSACEMVLALYFGGVLRHDPKNPDWPDRDRFILSKGHAAPLLYTVLAYAGYFDKSLLDGLRSLGSLLQGHVERGLPGVESTHGSLGHGHSVANGLALAARVAGRDYRVYVMVSDGDMQEGQFWEAAMTATTRRLDNVTLLCDNNDVQLDGFVHDIKPTLYPVAEKLRAFGWEVVEIDGHDFPQIFAALAHARATKGRPTALAARTVKGKGVPLFENKAKYHGVAPTDDELAMALKILA